jgi:hypothetical protein
MGKAFNPGKPTQQPLDPVDFFGGGPTTIVDPLADSTIKGTVRNEGNTFNPDNFKDESWFAASLPKEATPYDNPMDLEAIRSNSQSVLQKIHRGGKQFNTNLASAFLQGAANTFDVTSWGNDDYVSSLFGWTTKEMNEWSQGVAARNQVYENNPGKFNPGDLGWVMNQFASAGTGVGMAGYAALETALIEGLTFGTGSAAAIARVGKLFKGMKNAGSVVNAAEHARGLKSAATIYGVLNRANESRMEAMMSYQEIEEQMKNERNPDGTAKYTDEQIKEAASEGADRTFMGNLALMPLDILTYRAMVYNPVSGRATGALERMLSNIGNKAARKATQYGIASASEGTEELFQYVTSQEGKHYAKVLSGQDDASTFLGRLGETLQTDEAWNNFAGGVIGAPIIGGAMRLSNKVGQILTGKNNTAKLNSLYKNYVENVGKIDANFIKRINEAEKEGYTATADVLRRQHSQHMALKGLHLDAMKDSDAGFDSYLHFLEGTLSELQQGKTDALQDLGITLQDDEHKNKVINDFATYIDDAKTMKKIYDDVKNKFSRDVIPEVTYEYFKIDRNQQRLNEIDQKLNEIKSNLFQYNNLSTQGKNLYDSEYVNKALLSEKQELESQLEDATNSFERKNIESMIQRIDETIKGAQMVLDQINNDQTYTKEQRTKDSDIINAAVVDNEYLIYNTLKQRYSNEIELQLKNIKNWNDKKFLDEREKEVIQKAKTKEQVKTAAENLKDKEGKLKPETEQAIKEKETEITAKTQFEATHQQTTKDNQPPFKEEQPDPNDIPIPGNADLFGQALDTVGELNKDNFKEETATERDAVLLFSPATIDESKFDDDKKQRVKAAVSAMINELGTNPTFERLVRAAISARGKEFADKNYNLLISGWALNNMPEQDYRAIYNKIFTDPFAELEDIGNEVLTAEQIKQQILAEKNNEQQQQKVLKELDPAKEEPNNKEIKIGVVHEGVVTHNVQPKFAKSLRLRRQKIEDGKVTWEYVSEGFTEGDIINSLPLLNPDAYQAGTQVEARVPENFMDIEVPIFNFDGSRTTIPFKDFVAQNNLKPTDQRYQDKIPIIIYNKGQKEGKGLAFVHDVEWYNEHNFDGKFIEEMNEAIANTRKIRQSILSNNNKALLTITENRPTTFDPFKTAYTLEGDEKRYEFKPFSEASPGSVFAVAKSPWELSFNNKDGILNDDENVIIIKNPMVPGHVYDIRRAGMKDGKKAWYVLQVTPPPISNEVKSTITTALRVYLRRKSTSPLHRVEDDPIIKQVKEIAGFDLTNDTDIQNFLRQFIQLNDVTNASSAQEAEVQIKNSSDYSVSLGGQPTGAYITFTKGPNVVVGIMGQNAFVRKKSDGTTEGVQSLFGNPNSTTPNTGVIEYLLKRQINKDGNKVSMLDTMSHHYHIKSGLNDKPVVHIVKGQVIKASEGYKDYLMKTFNTNLISVNVGTPEKPVWASSDNMISYELSKDQSQSGEKSAAELRAEILTDTTEVSVGGQENNTAQSQEDTTESIEEIRRKILEQAKKDLGIDFNNLPNFQSSRVLTAQEVAAVTALDVRIPGLNPKEENELVDFFVNQIFQRVSLKYNAIQKSEVKDQVQTVLKEIMQPIKEDRKQKAAHFKQLLKDMPQLADSTMDAIIKGYENEIAKFESVEAHIDMLYDKAFQMATLHTGQVKENKLKLEEQQDNDTEDEAEESVGEEGGVQEVDFFTDVLTLNPDNKISYNIRRFLRGIVQVTKDGNPVRGVFGIPVYESADNIIQVLMPMLADAPADFDSMINRMEQQQNFPWIKSVTDKLRAANQQTKNQFVTAMANSPLRLKFTMITQNKKTGAWTTAVWDTNEGGVAQQIRREWEANFFNSDLVMRETDEDGDSQLNKEKARDLLSTYETWLGLNTKAVQATPTNDFINQIRGVRKDNSVVVNPAGIFLKELQDNIKRRGDKMKFQINRTNYEIKLSSDGKYVVSFLQGSSFPDAAEVKKWLAGFGITPNDKTIKELVAKGMRHYKQLSYSELFQRKTGLFGILYDSLNTLVTKQGEHYFKTEGKSPIEETVVKSLAEMDAKFDVTHVAHGGRDGGKSYYAITANKFVTDRTKELKDENEVLRGQLKTLSFSKNSFWLSMMEDPEFRQKFHVAHESFNAMQIRGKKTRRDNAITKLSDLDYEVATAGKFWYMRQGDVTFQDRNVAPGTDIPMRMATMYAPTMSDKHVAIVITTAVLNLQNKHLNNGEGLTEDVTKFLYTQVVKPELERMLHYHNHVKQTNIKAYDKGAGMFLLLPELNNLEFDGSRFTEVLANKPEGFNLEMLEANDAFMKQIYTVVNKTVDHLKNEKLQVWEKDGVFKLNDKDEITSTFINDEYINGQGKFVGTGKQKLDMAAYDLVVNQMVSLANSYMLYVGDPALYYKKDSTTNKNDFTQIAKDTFVNVGKRLANQIAPGTTIANSQNENYLQLFIQDRNSVADRDFIKYSTRILDKQSITDEEIDTVMDYHATGEKEDQFKAIKKKYPRSAGFLEIEAADAQEYTTWQEHLSILEKLGRTPDIISDITAEQIQEARDLFSKGTPKSQLTEAQLELIAQVMQPIKPVYTGQHYDGVQDVMRVVYVKSSSFPLIPQLTEGLELDKLRLKMEEIQKNKNMKVRASYQTANKVGAMNNAPNIWDRDGRISDEGLSQLEAASLIMHRKNFRIQQEVPFKSGKAATKEDKQTYGTQLMKLLFGNDIINFNGFSYQGNTMTGLELQQKYNDLHIKLVESRKQQLYNELGLDESGNIIDRNKTFSKLHNLLAKEAEQRNFPLQSIEGLKYTGEGVNRVFTLPLWASINSNKFEALLNAIIVNRLVRIKFPGNSYVVGSEEGFKLQENLEGVDQSRIVFTESWTGELKATYHADGKIKRAQVMTGSKFRDNSGNLIDLFEGFNGQQGKYITKTEKGTYLLKTDMFDKSLLRLTSFRIPTTGISSGSEIEIVGFLPYQNADLMIVPKNFTKQKGLDFDVDKENSYQYWHYQTENGKFEKLSNKHKAEIIAKFDDRLKDAHKTSNVDPGARMFNQYFNDLAKEMGWEEYTGEELNYDATLKKVNEKLDEKILQNSIIEVYESVYTNPDPKLQAKINNVLNTAYSEQEAHFIDTLKTSNNPHWTPLSGQYQKEKMQLGAQGKVGTGAYALDITFHSLVQQAKALGTPLTLMETVGTGKEAYKQPKKWRFGKLDKDGVESSGVLGETMTVDGGRTTSDLLNEIGQIAVDNEKLQIMGRVNINGHTLDVHKMFNLLGIDSFKSKDKHNVGFLFLSQPILMDYVEEVSNMGSNLNTEFVANREQKVLEKLMNKYLPGWENMEFNQDWQEKMADKMDEANMVKNIKGEIDNELQAAILRRFLEMKQWGLAVRNIQTTLNTDSKGLDKSFFNVIQKKEKIDNLGKGVKVGNGETFFGEITNATALVGKYIERPSSPQDVDNFLKQGYYDTGNFLVKPTTLTGGFNIIPVTVGYNLWHEHLPFDGPVLNALYEEILPTLQGDNPNDVRQIELKQEILAEFKKYIATAKINGFVQETEDIKEERERLYIDTDKNTSLATYLSELMKVTGNDVIDTFLKSNKLLNRFTYELNKNGTPSLIKYNNVKGETFDEAFLYNSLTQLMEVGSYKLPDYNGKEYTLMNLAQDLITYSMIGNAKQEAIQFTKYIPVSYLNVIGYSKTMRVIHDRLKREAQADFGINMRTDTTNHMVSPFTTQFMQHNPELVKTKLSREDFNKTMKKQEDGSFIHSGPETVKPTFISVYDSSVKDSKKFRLYKYNGATYEQIPILGVFGMDEYKWNAQVGESSVNGKQKKVTEPEPQLLGTLPDQENNPFMIHTGTLTQVVESIASSSNKFAPLAKTLLPFIKSTKIEVSKELGVRWGQYTDAKNLIEISEGILNNDDLLAETVIHELVHALTVRQILPYLVDPLADTVEVRPNAPVYVTQLVAMYNNLRNEANKGLIAGMKLAMAQNKPLTQQERDEAYGFNNILEFMAMATTDKGFQNYLAKIPYKGSNKSFLDKLKEIVGQILTSLGAKFDEKFTLAHAVNTIFEVIEKENVKEEFDPYMTFNEDDFDQQVPDWFDENNTGPVDLQTSISVVERQSLINEVIKNLDKVPDMYRSFIQNDPETALREIAMQLNDAPSAAEETRATFGKKISDIALRLYPSSKNPSTQQADEFIKSLDSNQKNCD